MSHAHVEERRQFLPSLHSFPQVPEISGGVFLIQKSQKGRGVEKSDEKGQEIFGNPRSYTFGGKIFDAKHDFFENYRVCFCVFCLSSKISTQRVDDGRCSRKDSSANNFGDILRLRKIRRLWKFW